MMKSVNADRIVESQPSAAIRSQDQQENTQNSEKVLG